MPMFRVHALVNEDKREKVIVTAKNPADAIKEAVNKIRSREEVAVIRVLKTKAVADA